MTMLRTLAQQGSAEAYTQLSRLYAQNGKTAHARTALEQAAELGDHRAILEPDRKKLLAARDNNRHLDPEYLLSIVRDLQKFLLDTAGESSTPQNLISEALHTLELLAPDLNINPRICFLARCMAADCCAPDDDDLLDCEKKILKYQASANAKLPECFVLLKDTDADPLSLGKTPDKDW